MVLHLGPWGKVLVMAIGASVVMITLIIVVCFVGPGCWGYNCIHREEVERRRRRRANKIQDQIAENSLKLADYGTPWNRDSVPSYVSYDTVSSTGSLVGRMPQHRDSTYSSMSETTDNRSLSIKSVVTEDSVNSEGNNKPSPAVLTITLQYLASDDNGSGKLVIYIKDIKDLPPRDYIGGLEPYLVVEVVRTTWPLHRRRGPPVHQLRTRTLRHSFNPFFDQQFIIDVKRSEVKELCLKMSAYDQDKYSNATELCDGSLALREVKNLTASGEAITVSCNLTRTKREVGDLLFGVSYLPTAQRLSVSIIKATNLKYMEVVDTLSEFNPYVRVIQLNGNSGRSVRRKKTAFKQATECPEFNETLTFDLSPHQLETATFLVLLCSKLVTENNGMGGNHSPSNKRTKDKCLGKVALGSHVLGKSQREHWLSVIQSPRRVVSVWHTLK